MKCWRSWSNILRPDSRINIDILLEQLYQPKGKTIFVEDWLCVCETNYDRHFTSFGQLEIEVEEIFARISGGMVSIGNEKQNIEFRLDTIRNMEITDEHFTVEIQVWGEVWRRIKISETS